MVKWMDACHRMKQHDVSVTLHKHCGSFVPNLSESFLSL